MAMMMMMMMMMMVVVFAIRARVLLTIKSNKLAPHKQMGVSATATGSDSFGCTQESARVALHHSQTRRQSQQLNREPRSSCSVPRGIGAPEVMAGAYTPPGPFNHGLRLGGWRDMTWGHAAHQPVWHWLQRFLVESSFGGGQG
ncbi:hypothetical protein B0T13DRAFT_155275 [Neurospora crassa]|nr:hypothetical protein B0T13DRAFT_155275 [Neurospora crassa]